MRIIAGTCRGRRLAAPEGLATRPMLDRVREALFGRLGPSIEGARVLDLFAGSGSLGLEAASRGAALVVAVERARPALEVLRANVLALGLSERVHVRAGDALDPALWPPPDDERGRYDLILLDPPYPLLAGEERAALFAAIGRLAVEWARPAADLVLHAPPGSGVADDLPAALHPEERVYGRSALWWLRARGGGGEVRG